MRLILPAVFYFDHADRGLPAGRVIRRTKRYVEIHAGAATVAEILSDARYYADPTGAPDWAEGAGIRASARATVRAIERQTSL